MVECKEVYGTGHSSVIPRVCCCSLLALTLIVDGQHETELSFWSGSKGWVPKCCMQRLYPRRPNYLAGVIFTLLVTQLAMLTFRWYR